MWEDPSTAELARSIGCEPDQIIRSERNKIKTDLHPEGKQVWTSFVDQGDPDRAAVFETVWPQ